MRPKVEINGVDITSTIDINKKIKIDKFISNNLNTYNTVEFEVKETGEPLWESFSDTFSRRQRGSPTLGYTELGHLAWTPIDSSVWAIKDGTAVIDSDGTLALANLVTLTTAYTNLIYISADITFGGSIANEAGIVFGYTNDANFWAWLGNQDGTVELVRYIAGVQYNIWADTTPIYGNGNFRVQILDNVYSIYWNNTLLYSYTDTFPLGIDVHGLWIDPGLASVGDFQIDNFKITRFTYADTVTEIPYVRDTFTRFDNYTIPAVYTLGNLESPVVPWQITSGSTWEVTSTSKAKVHSGSGTATGDIAYVPIGKSVEIAVEVDLNATGGTAQIGLVFGLVDPTHYYYVEYSTATGDINLYHLSGSTATSLAADTTTVSGGTTIGTLKALVHNGLCAVYWNTTLTTIAATAVTLDPTVINYAGLWSNSGISITTTFDNFIVRSYMADSLTPLEYKEIIITDLDTNIRLFGGYIDFQKSFYSNGLILHRTITAKDWSLLLEKTEVTQYEVTGVTDASIINDLMGTYFPSSYFPIVSVTSSGTINGTFSVNHESVQVAIQRLCNLTGATFYIDDNRGVHYFFGNEFVSAAFSIDQLDGYSNNFSSIRYAEVMDIVNDKRDLSSRVRLIGGVDAVTNYAQTISAGSSTPLASYQLTYGNITDIASFTASNSGGSPQPIPWTYRDNNDPRKTPVEPARVDPTTSDISWFVFQALGTSSTYLGGGISPGEKLVIFQSTVDPGFAYKSNVYHFEGGFRYTITYTDGNVAIKKGSTNGIAGVDFSVVTDSSSIFSSTTGVLFIGEGWPAVVNAATGLITYCPVTGSGGVGHSFGPISGITNIVTYSASRQYMGVATDSTLRSVYGANGLGGGGWEGGGNRWLDTVIKNDQLNDPGAIDAAARAYLSLQSGVQSLELESRYMDGLKPGQTVNIRALQRGVNGDYVVNKITAEIGEFMNTGEYWTDYHLSAGKYNPQEVDLFAALANPLKDVTGAADSPIAITHTVDYPS